MDNQEAGDHASPRRRLSVALPGSLTRDIPHLREKTARIGMVARTLAIFGVDRVLIYRDEPSARVWEEASLLEKILRFQETPQYLRRHMFKLDPDLQFSGTLPPLRIPSHPDRAEPRIGLVREAFILSSGDSVSQADAGFNRPVLVRGRLPVSRRVTVQVKSTSPQLEAEVVDPRGLRIYWGFKVQREDAPLAWLSGKMNSDLTVGTSRDGTDVRDVMADLKRRWRHSQRPLVLFGSPERSVEQILAETQKKVGEVADINLNTVPQQNVETVRTEEALMITLSILNALEDT